MGCDIRHIWPKMDFDISINFQRNIFNPMRILANILHFTLVSISKWNWVIEIEYSEF